MNVHELGGRALDVAVAKYVFGLEVEERTFIMLEAKLADLGWHQRQSPFLRWPDPVGTVLITLEKGDERADALGKTFGDALSRVALKVVQEGWTAAERLSHERSIAVADARLRAEQLVSRFEDCDSEPAAEWRLRGLETAKEWLRLIESPFASQEEVSSLIVIAKANQRTNYLWRQLGRYVWVWASQMGYTVPILHDYLH